MSSRRQGRLRRLRVRPRTVILVGVRILVGIRIYIEVEGGLLVVRVIFVCVQPRSLLVEHPPRLFLLLQQHTAVTRDVEHCTQPTGSRTLVQQIPARYKSHSNRIAIT